MPEPITAKQFEKADAETKGYLVYMAGMRSDQPNVPRTYKPSKEDEEAYRRGERQAILEVQDDA